MPANRNYGLKLADPDCMDKWRADAEARERERSHDRGRERDAVFQLRVEVEQLQADVAAAQELQAEAAAAVTEFASASSECLERAVQKLQREFWGALERKFAALNARFDVVMLMMSEGHDAKSRADKLRVRTPMDIPNPLSPRRGLN